MISKVSPATSTSKPPSDSQACSHGLVAAHVGQARRRTPTVSPQAALVTWPTASPARRISSPPHSIGSGLVHHETHQSAPRIAGQRPGPLLLKRRPPQEVLLALQRGGEDQPRLHRRVVGRQFAAERAIPLLQPQRLDRVVAGVRDPEVARRPPSARRRRRPRTRRARAAPSPARRRTSSGSPAPSHGPATSSGWWRTGTPPSPRSASVSRGSRSRDCGPITPSTAYAVVTSRTATAPRRVQVPADPVLVAHRGGRTADQQELVVRRPG